MAVKILWYLTEPDGTIPWTEEGRWDTDFKHLQQLAGTIDKLGYYGALLAGPTLHVAAATFSVTERMKFIVAQHPGEVQPAILANYAKALNRFSNNRFLFNAVNGNDAGMASVGVNFEHDERYEYSREYWDVFRRVYADQGGFAGLTEGYDGKYIKLAPRPALPGRRAPSSQQPLTPPPLWGAGTSPAGVAHSVEVLDVYLSFANTPQLLGEKFKRVEAEAAKIGRAFQFNGTRLQVIVRETEEEAWEYAQYLVDNTPLEYAIQNIKRQLPPGETIDSYRSPDPQIQKNIEAIKAGHLPPAKDFEIYPNIWTGPALHGFNILGPGAGTTLVGSAENVAARIREFNEHGTHAFILSGWPLIEEAHRFANLVFPLLDLDHGFEVPILNKSRRKKAIEAGLVKADAANEGTATTAVAERA
ncbi:LLM class flavin-dependent oxidoreductase [Cellvibrio polysaccharolyticus]|uniref:LLM class flavin-dependent oxidoreductase n=1 Tax=Cellvibrio polysaccharolyticus TaxID=2082724 RepID=A0A928YS72_9GAMM|nr:LLM class flavin-dependent oxidoreductase [Cellvibrio polysaccharolyticus]MBE8715709.1 LLM class flavin-dependent oxidoreductase [Cellvibrio polysaccharolyticus]